MTPTVSVLVTVYNREAYLQETLKSILASTFDNFEVLVVDDCSTDQSVRIAQQIQNTDPRVQVILNEQNLGDYGNRMKAASLAKGKYLKYVDSDDLIYPHSLQLMVDAMERHADAAIGLAHSLPEDDSPYPWLLEPAVAYQKQFLDRGCMSCGPTGAIIRHSAFQACGGFHKQWGVLSDRELWLRMAATWPIVLLPPGLVWWRRHEGQEFTSGDAAAVYLERGYQLEVEALNSTNCPLADADLTKAQKKVAKCYARRLLSMATRQRSPLKACRLFRKSNLKIMDLVQGIRPYR